MSTLVVGCRYRLDARLGAGGYGEAWRATDLLTGATVVVKQPYGGAPESAGRAAIESEAAILEHLHHPGAVRLLDRGVDAGRPFLVLEHLDGETLAAALESGRRLDDADTVALGLALLGVLGEVHRCGSVHGDVKPSNVMLTAAGPKLIDFGAALPLDATLPPIEARRVVGTLACLAPELLVGEPPSPASDIYAVGVTLYEARTGRLPFGPADVAPGARRTIVPLTTMEPGASPRLARALERALSGRPQERFRSAAEMARALSEVGQAGQPADPGPRRGRVLSARTALAAGALVGLALGFGGLIALGGRDEPERSPSEPSPGDAALPTTAAAIAPPPTATATPPPPTPTSDIRDLHENDDDDDRGEDGNGGERRGPGRGRGHGPGRR